VLNGSLCCCVCVVLLLLAQVAPRLAHDVFRALDRGGCCGVADEWPASCEHNLTKPGDKRAWIGHAAVAMAIKCPEDIVREAWGDLTDEQRERANAKASEAIAYWKSKHA
jgi:hypothetical protein